MSTYPQHCTPAPALDCQILKRLPLARSTEMGTRRPAAHVMARAVAVRGCLLLRQAGEAGRPARRAAQPARSPGTAMPHAATCTAGWVLVSVALLAAPVTPLRSSNLWFWSCDNDPGGEVDPFWTQLAPHVFSASANSGANRFLTGLIPACGVSLGDVLPAKGAPLAPADRRGGFTFPCCSQLHGLSEIVNRSHANGVKVYPLITGYTDTGPLQLRRFLANASLVQRFTDALVTEAVKHDWDGYSFDWEFRGWDLADERENAAFLEQLADRMDAVGKNLSVAIDNATHPNFDLHGLRAHPSVQIITMSSYSANETAFKQVVTDAVAVAGTRSYSCGLSSSWMSWGRGTPPSAAAVDERFAFLAQSGVESVSIFGDWMTTTNDSAAFFESFVPAMRRFLQGGSNGSVQ